MKNIEGIKDNIINFLYFLNYVGVTGNILA